MTDDELEKRIARKGRVVAVVIAATMVIWLAGTALVGQSGGELRWLVLFDLAALAAFVWVFANIWQILRLRKLRNNGQR